jgi:hypothetical protein
MLLNNKPRAANVSELANVCIRWRGHEAPKKDTWSDWFPESKSLRLYMDDNTDVPLMRPSDPDLRKALYSDYYGGCVAEDGVVLQQCGWIRSVPLCTGGIGDQDYLSKTKIFEKQKAFAMKDDTADETGLNVLDKGCRSKFNGERTLHSAAVAVVRSGNE